MKRKATAVWSGSGKEGKGVLSGPSGVLNQTPYSFAARFANEDGKAGTNPEELLAASHAGCFAMALSFQLGNEGFTPEELHTDAIVTIESVDGGFAITKIDLILKAKIEGIEESKFLEIAKAAKEGCPISKALSSVEISLKATLA